MDAVDKKIINTLQDGFPIGERPYQTVAQALGISESLLIERLKTLLEDKTLSRFGPMYNAKAMGGELSLAAMKIPPEELDHVADIVNAMPQIAHNYERTHELNMWFVIATEKPEEAQETINQIEKQTGYRVYNMPKEEEFYVRLKFQL